MTTIVLSFAIFALAILGLASGLLLSGRRIQGSCGGLNQVAGVDSDCGGVCQRPCPKRQARMARARGVPIKARSDAGRHCDVP